MSVPASSCASLQVPPNVLMGQQMQSVALQTEISCRQPSGFASPVSNLSDIEERCTVRERLAASLLAAPPAPPAHSPRGGPERAGSILGSVCALLLKQGSAASGKAGGADGGAEGARPDNICRICFGGESAERLTRPCGCRGTVAAVHRSCLERWLLHAASSHCELCRHHYIVTRKHKWSLWRSAVEWVRGGRGRALASDAGRAAALGAASVLGTARALHACDRALQLGARRGGAAALLANVFSSLLIGIIGALNGLLTTWMLLKLQEHQAAWRAWRDSTLHVHVWLADETPCATPPSPALTPPASPRPSRSAVRPPRAARPDHFLFPLLPAARADP